MSWSDLPTVNTGEVIASSYGNTIQADLAVLKSHGHNPGTTGDGSGSLGPLVIADFTDASAPAAPGSGKTRFYSVSGKLHARAGAAGADAALSLSGHGKSDHDTSVITLVSRAGTLTSVANTTTGTTILNANTDAAATVDGEGYELEMWGDILYNNSTADTLTVSHTNQGTNIMSGNFVVKPNGAALSATRWPFYWRVRAIYDLSNNTTRYHHEFRTGGSNGVAVANFCMDVASVAGAVGVAGATQFQPTVQWSAASANNAFRLMGWSFRHLR